MIARMAGLRRAESPHSSTLNPPIDGKNRRSCRADAPPSAGDLAATAAFALASFLMGGLFFRYLKRGFADVL